jgi:hypothetical protein
VHVRKKANIEAGTDAFIVTEKEEVFDLRELGGINGDEELVDAVAFEEGGEIRPGVDGVIAANVN